MPVDNVVLSETGIYISWYFSHPGNAYLNRPKTHVYFSGWVIAIPVATKLLTPFIAMLPQEGVDLLL